MYHTYTLRTENYADPVKESCAPTGYNIKHLGAEFLDQPCVNGMMFNYEENLFVLDNSSVTPVSFLILFCSNAHMFKPSAKIILRPKNTTLMETLKRTNVEMK